jgi:superfamily II RNA helicase
MTQAVQSPLTSRLPAPEDAQSDLVFDRFLDYVAEKELELYPAQEEALLEICAGKNVILNTPTGSGKSLVATAMHFLAMAEGKRSFYTCPIKALVSEKFFALCRDFGPENVGMMTGDASVNRDAPIICCTAEILSNIALREGARADVDYVIMDEFHYYADRDRGVAWQVPLLTLPHATYLLMSATLGGAEDFARILTQLNGRETALVRSRERPVPLDFEYRETPLHETVHSLVEKDRAPIYIVCFTQRAAAEEAQNLMSLDYASKEDKRSISRALEGTRFDSPYGKDLSRYVRHGIGLHHAGLLPKYRLLVEKLAQKGLLKVICGTDTLGVGVNIPIRTVLFTKLCKYDGQKTAILSVRDFQQISGRAGRKGFDTRGTVVALAPEHVIENMRLEAKAGNDPVKKKRIVRKKPPEKGYVHWDKQTFERLIKSDPEPLVSRFQVSHGMLLNVLQRETDGCRAMKRLLNDVHETPAQRRIHKKTALSMFRSLVQGGVIELGDKDGSGRRLRVNTDLQQDFSLNHALGLWLLESVELIDKERETYALDVLTLVESILENPDLILQKQLDKLKREKLFELKAAGVEYDDRIAELDKMEYVKPNAEFVYATFNDFARRHPWVGQDNIRPKSIARDMYESLYSFSDYVKEYELMRSEGLLLRYLSDVYKALAQTVPERAKTDEIDDIEIFLGAIVRQVDSSLLEEWERMRNPSRLVAVAVEGAPEQRQEEIDITSDNRAFVALIRNEIFSLVRALSRRDYDTATKIVADGGEDWTIRRFEEALAPFWQEHSEIRTDPAARNPQHTQIRQWPYVWEFVQIIVDESGDGDWALEGVIDLDKSRTANRPVLSLRKIGS